MTLTATIRLARDLTAKYEQGQLAAGRRTFPKAPVTYFGAWLSELWTEWLYSGLAESPGRPLRPFEEQLVWEDIICSGSRERLLDAAATAALAQRAWKEVCDGQLPTDAAEWTDSEDLRTFRSWLQAFRRRCRDTGWFSSAELPGIIGDLIARHNVPVPDHVELAGFFEPTPAQERVFEALNRRGTRILERSYPAREPSGVRVGFPDTTREIRAAAKWSRGMLEKEPNAANPDFGIGIIVPNLDGLRSQIERIFGQELHPRTQLHPDSDQNRLFNISLGLPLGAYPLVKTALLLLEINPRRIPIAAASRLVRSPFLTGADEEYAKRSLLDVALRNMGEYHVTAADILRLSAKTDTQHSCPVLARQVRIWQRGYAGLPARALPSDWADALAAFLRQAGWPGSRTPSSDEYQTLQAWQDLLSDLAGLDAICGSIHLAAVIGLLRRMAAARLFQPESQPAPVQIMGHYEASGLGFNRLWLLGMHENVWPAAPAFNPFVPQRLRRRMGLARSSAESELEFAKGLSDRLISSAPFVVVSYPRREGDADMHASPLFAGLAERSAEDLELSLSGGRAERSCGKAAMEWLDDHDGPSFNGTVARGGSRLFKLQAACPFKAFAELRLDAAALEFPQPGLSALDRGKLIHRILESLWEQLESHDALLSIPDDELSAVVRERVVAEIRRLSAHRRTLGNVEYARIEQERLEGIVAQWLALEKTRQPFEALEQEKERHVQLGGLGVDIRADRVDRLQDGSCVIIDYKTGKCEISAWRGTRPDEPQLPIYAVTSDVPVAGVFFGSLKPGEIKFEGIADSEESVPHKKSKNMPPLPRAMAEWEGPLAQLGSDFRAGRAVVDPKDRRNSCKHCALTAFCRIGQTVTRRQEDDA